MVENPPADARDIRDAGSMPGWEDPLEGGHGKPTPMFLPGKSQEQGAWWAAVSGVAQSRTRLKRLSSSLTNHRNCSRETKAYVF